MTEAVATEAKVGLWEGLLYVRRGLLWGLAGFGIGAGLAALFHVVTGSSAWWIEHNVTVGYVFGLLGWLLGVGMWERWAREWLGLPTAPDPTGWRRYFAFTTDHKVIGVQYLVTFVVVMLIGGLMAMLVRYHLTSPQGALMDDGVYNQVMSLHGILMIAVAVAVGLGGPRNSLAPLPLVGRARGFPPPDPSALCRGPPAAGVLLAGGGAPRRATSAGTPPTR